MIAVPIRRKLKIALRKIYGGPWYKKLVVWPCTFVLLLILGLGAVDCNFLYLFVGIIKIFSCNLKNLPAL